MSNGESRSKPVSESDPPPTVQEVSPSEAYRRALRGYDGATLADLATAVGLSEAPAGRPALAARVAERVAEPRALATLTAGLPHAARLVLTLAAVSETTAWPARALRHALAVLGAEAADALGPLVGTGLVAVAVDGVATLREPAGAVGPAAEPAATVYVHPSAVASARTVLPALPGPPRCGPVHRPREADGLEPIVRLAALWQRVSDAPLRQTQQGTLYKRDRDRLEDDVVLAGPIADALEPIPDMAAVWLALALGVGLVAPEPGTERVVAAHPGYWADNALHLPRTLALRWLALADWHELGGMQREGATEPLALPHVRAAVLLWLATLGPDEWVATADLAAFLRALSPHWAASSFLEVAAAAPGPRPADEPPGRPKARKGRGRGEPDPAAADRAALEAMLLGAAYQFGLVRAGEEAGTGRRAVQLTELGRYVLALGPPPAPRSNYEHFLFVQPNFEVIAYRQGLTPALVGQFSRFTLWTQAGAALAMRLTPESVYRGLEGGLSAEDLLSLLGRHSSRPLPSAVTEAVRTWAGRRDRVTYHASATLVEFATPADLEAALHDWPRASGPLPERVSDRLLLVEEGAEVPWGRFRMTGSRNYRLPAEACVEVEPDGVTLTLDLARSDLLVDAELARFADEEPAAGTGASATRRRFVVSAGSLARAEALGLTPAALAQWYERRTQGIMPPSVRLLLAARGPKPPALTAGRLLVVQAHSAEVLDGLAQHPETRDLLGDRLGPTAVVVAAPLLERLGRALGRLGLALDEAGGLGVSPVEGGRPVGSRAKPR